MQFVYIIYSKSTDTFYKGHSNDVHARVDRHNKGYENFTAYGRPWILIWSTEKDSKSEAYKLEVKLKNLSRERLIKFMLKYEMNVGGPDELFLIKQLSGC